MPGLWEFVVEEIGSEDEASKFCSWAFGEGWETKPISHSPDLWNERHSDLFISKGTDERTEGIRKMIEAYREHGQKNS